MFSNYSRPSRASQVTRVVILVNLLLVLVLFGPITHGVAERAFRTLGSYPILPWTPDLWVVASTFLASVLFAYELFKMSRSAAGSESTKARVVVDGVLLGAWWLVLVAICVYAFALGHGG